MRFTLAVLLALVIALIPATLFAQSRTVFCGSLDSTDCDLLVEAAENDEDVTDGAYNVEFEVLLSNIPDAPINELGLKWLQTGVYTSDPDLREELVADIDIGAPDALQNVDAMMQFIEAFLASANTEQDITLILSDALVDAINEESDIPIPGEINLRFSIIDGVIYLDLEALADVIPDIGGFGGWVGTELTPFVRMALEQAAADPEAAGALMTVAGVMAATTTADGKAAMSEAQDAQLAMMEDYLSIERLEDDEPLEEEDAAVFLTTFDFADFAASPEFMDLVGQQLMMAEQMGQDVPSAAEMADIEKMMPLLAPVIFDSLNYDVYQLIGLDSGLTRVNAVDMNWDMTALLEMAAESGEDVPDEAPLVEMYAVVDKYAQNEVGSIEPPEGAFVVPAQMLLSMMQ